MTRTYDPATHDPILTGLHTDWKLTDGEIAERMQFSIDIIRDNRRRLGLPGHERLDTPPVRPNPRPDALEVAAKHLKGFDRDAMTLRGRPIKLDEVMNLTNAELVKKGLPQILYSERWRVPG